MNDILGQAEVSQLTPGQIIRSARESKQISLNDVAQRLLLSKQIIAALEEDDYSKISAKVYAEGYLKAYAQFLQIPVDEVLKSFRRLNVYSDVEIKSEAKSQAKPSQISDNIGKNKNTQVILLGILAVLILGILIMFIFKLPLNKASEITNVPSVVNNQVDDSAKAEQPPMVTTTTDDETTASDSEKVQKDEDFSKVNKQEAAGPLMLDLPADEVKSKKAVKRK